MYSHTWPGFNISNLAPKSGQLLVIGPEKTYALKAYTSRFALSPALKPETKGYLLVADDNHNEPTMDPRAWGKDKGMGFSRGAPPVWHHWLPVRVQAMVLAGKTLAVCGPPDVLKKDDAMASFEGRMGSALWTLSAENGKITSQQKMPEAPDLRRHDCRPRSVVCLHRGGGRRLYGVAGLEALGLKWRLGVRLPRWVIFVRKQLELTQNNWAPKSTGES